MRIHTKTLYKGSDTPEKEKLLTVCLFRKKTSYRGFEKYLNFSINLIDQITRILPQWIIRFYVDESVKEDELEKLKHPSVQIVLYKCEDFWDESSGTHEGIFGMFVRYIPMFSAQKYKAYIATDVDLDDFWFEYMKYLDKHAEQVGLVNQLCHNDWTPEYLEYSILGGGIYSKIVFPRPLLMDFLKKLKEGKFSLRVIKQTDTETFIPYGADEYFLTTRFYTYLQEHKIKILTLTIATVVGAMGKVLKDVKDKDRKDTANDILTKARYYDYKFWRDPRSLRPDVFVRDLKKIIKIVEPEFVSSRYSKCILEYLNEPKLTSMRKFNY